MSLEHSPTRQMDRVSAGDSFADDVLRGVTAIAAFRGEKPRRTYHLLETGQIPGYKEGGLWNSRKSTQLAHTERREAEAMVE